MSIISWICWFHPVHLSFSCSYIWTRDINCSSNWIFLGQLKSVLSSKSLNLFCWIISRIETDTALGSSVWDVNSSTFKSHQTSQSLNLMDIDILSISCSSFSWEFICFMLASVGRNYFNSSIIWINDYLPLVRVRLNLTTLSALL